MNPDTEPQTQPLHDAAGIHGYIDRRTGRLMDCFRPRYARGVTA